MFQLCPCFFVTGRAVVPSANGVIAPEVALPITHTPAKALLHVLKLYLALHVSHLAVSCVSRILRTVVPRECAGPGLNITKVLPYQNLPTPEIGGPLLSTLAPALLVVDCHELWRSVGSLRRVQPPTKADSHQDDQNEEETNPETNATGGCVIISYCTAEEHHYQSS